MSTAPLRDIVLANFTIPWSFIPTANLTRLSIVLTANHTAHGMLKKVTELVGRLQCMSNLESLILTNAVRIRAPTSLPTHDQLMSLPSLRSLKLRGRAIDCGCLPAFFIIHPTTNCDLGFSVLDQRDVQALQLPYFDAPDHASALRSRASNLGDLEISFPMSRELIVSSIHSSTKLVVSICIVQDTPSFRDRCFSLLPFVHQLAHSVQEVHRSGVCPIYRNGPFILHGSSYSMPHT